MISIIVLIDYIERLALSEIELSWAKSKDNPARLWFNMPSFALVSVETQDRSAYSGDVSKRHQVGGIFDLNTFWFMQKLSLLLSKI